MSQINNLTVQSLLAPVATITALTGTTASFNSIYSSGNSSTVTAAIGNVMNLNALSGNIVALTSQAANVAALTAAQANVAALTAAQAALGSANVAVLAVGDVLAGNSGTFPLLAANGLTVSGSARVVSGNGAVTTQVVSNVGGLTVLQTGGGQQLSLQGTGSAGVAMSTFAGRPSPAVTVGAIDDGNSSSPLVVSVAPTGTPAATAVERLRLTTAGLLGLGTAAPAYLMDVAGNARVQTQLVAPLANVGALGATSANVASLGVGALTAASVAAGNVGILTAAPAYPLDVAGVARVAQLLTPLANVGALGAASANVASLGVGALVVANAVAGALSAANVGIMTANPAYPLDVAGVARVQTQLLTPLANVGTLGATSANVVSLGVGALGATSANVASLGVGALTAASAFAGALSATNVGILTTTPAFPLDVAGVARVQTQLLTPLANVGTLGAGSANVVSLGVGALGATSANVASLGVGALTAANAVAGALSAANVGILTATPAYPLDVAGVARVQTQLLTPLANVGTLGAGSANVASLGVGALSATTVGAGSLTTTGSVGILTAAPAFPLDVAGTARVTSLLTPNATLSASNPILSVTSPGDLVSLRVASLADRFGLAVNSGVSRVFTSAVQPAAQVALALASTDGVGGSASAFTDLLYAGNTAVGVTRTLLAPAANVVSLVAQSANVLSLVAQASALAAANIGQLTVGSISGGSGGALNASQLTANSVTANVSFLGNVQGPLTVSGDIVFTGNLRQILFANTPPGAFLNYTFGNLAAANASVAGLLTSSVANTGLLTAGATAVTSYPVSLATTPGAYTQICTFSDPQNAATYMIRVTLAQSRTSNAVLKTYNLPMSFSSLPGTWLRCLPRYNLGPSNGNDFALDVTSSGSTVTIRAVRLSNSGASSLTGLTASVVVTSDSGFPIALAPDGTTGTGATNAGLYAGSPLGSSGANVGILTAAPAYPLDVAGSARVQGAILGQTATIGTLTVGNIYGFSPANLSVIAGNLSVTAGSVNVANAFVLALGSDQVKEPNAGKLGYGTLSAGGSLDVVGAGAAVGARKVQIYDQLGVGGLPSTALDVFGNARITSANASYSVQTTTSAAGISLVQSGPGGSLGPVVSLQGTGSGGASVGLQMATYARASPLVSITALDDGAGGNPLLFSTGVGLPERARLTPTGQLGLGTPTPAALLDVAGAARVQGPLTAQVGVAVSAGNVLVAAGNVNVQGAGVVALGSDQAREPNAGKLGYGTFSSGAAVDVVGAGTVSGQRKVQLLDWVGVGGVPGMPLDVTGNTRVTASNSSFTTQFLATPAGLSLVSAGTPPGGIVPALLLQGGGGGAGVQTGLGLATFGRGAAGPSATISALDDASGSGPLLFGVASGGGSAVERARLTGAGQLGVSTTAPAATLDVGGNARVLTALGVGTLPSFPLDVAGSGRVQGSLGVAGAAGPAYPLDVYGVVRAAANNASTRPTALRLENLSTGPLGATLDLASQFPGLAQANKIAGQLYAEPDNSTGGRLVVATCNTAGTLQTAVTINAQQQVGVGTANPAYPLDVAGTGRVPTLLTSNVQAALANVTSLGAGTLSAATLLNAGAFAATAYSINLAAAVGSYTQICNSNDPQATSTYMIRVVLVQARTSNALLKSYSIPVTASYFAGSFLRCIPEFSLGASSGNDFALDVYQYGPNGAIYLRAVRTGSGTGTATGLTAYVTMTSDSGFPISFGYDGSTGTGATNAGLYAGCPLGCTAGNVGILTAAPAYPLDVAGTARVQGSLVASTFTGGNPTFYTNQLAALGSAPGFYMGSAFSTGNTGFLTFNQGPPSNAGSLGIGVFGMPGGGVTVANTGNVGIGQSLPGYLLDVGGAGRFAANLTVAGALAAGGANVGTLYCPGQTIHGSFIGDTSPGAAAGVVNRVANVSFVLPTNQAVNVLNSAGNPTACFVNTDYNYPNQAGPFPGGRMQVIDYNFGTEWRWQSKVPGAAGNPLVERLTITNGGSVGINQPQPAFGLDVGGTARATTLLTSNLQAAQGNVTSLGVGTLYASNIVGYLVDIAGNSATYTTVKASNLVANLVGINTATPVLPLDVAGGVRASVNTSTGRATALRVENLGSSAGGALIDMASQFSGLAQANKIAAQMYAEPDAGTGGRWAVATANTGGTLTQAVTINAAQQVGINTGSPAYPLDVNGQSRFATNQVWQQATAPGLYLGSAFSNGQMGYLSFNNPNPPSNTGSLGVGVYGATGGITVASSGNVGISASLPAYTLDVGGTARATTLLTSNLQAAQGNVTSLGVGTLYASNIVGYTAGGGSGNTTTISGNSATYNYVVAGNVVAANISTPNGLAVTAFDPGDMVARNYGAAGDRYGLNLRAGGFTRLFTSSAYGTATVSMSLASTDGPLGNAWTDLVTASQSSVVINRPLAVSGPIGYSATIPGDMVAKTYASAGDRYGLGQYNAATRLFTSSVNPGATVSLSLASTDGPAANAALWTDLVVASQSSVQFNRPAVLTSGNALQVSGAGVAAFGYDVTGKEQNAGRVGYGTFSGTNLDIVGAGTAPNKRTVQIYDNLIVSSGTVAGNVSAGTATLAGNLNAVGGVFTGNLNVFGSQGISGNLAVYGPQGVLVQSAAAAPLQLVSINGGAGNPIGVGLSTFVNRGAPACQVTAVDDGNFSAHLLLSSAPTGPANSAPVERLRVTSGGLVGVGTNNPQAGLDVAGSTRLQGNTTIGTAVTDTSVGAGASIVNRVANVSYAFPNQPTQVLGSAGYTTSSWINTDYNYPNQVGGVPGGRVMVNDSNFSADWRWQTKAPGAVTNALVERFTLTGSGNVGVNQTAPQFLLHAQPLATDVPAINPDATSTLVVYENCKGTALSAAATLLGNAYLNSGGYVQLTTNTNATTGCLNYNLNPGTAFDATFEYYVGTSGSNFADGIVFYCYCASPFPTIGPPPNSSGYAVILDEYGQNSGNTTQLYTAMLYYGSTLLASTTAATFTNPLNTWTQVRITFVRNVWRVWVGTQLVINFEDSSRTLVGAGTNNMGFVGSCGGSNAYHSIRYINIGKHTQGPWRPAAGGNVPGIQYSGPVTVAGNLAVSGSSAMGAVIGMPALNIGDWISTNYSPSVTLSDRYGIGQYNNGQMRVFASGYIPSLSAVSLSLAGSDSTAGGGSFTDILTASNSAVVLRRPVTAGSISASTAAISTFTGQPTFQTNQLYQKDNAPGFYLGRDFSTGNTGFITFNNAGPPSGPGTLGLGVYGQTPGGGLSVANTGYVGVNYSTPAFPLDVGGASRFNGNMQVTGTLAVTGPTTIASPITVTGVSPGDFLATVYSLPDRYGMGQYNNGQTRLFASATYSPAAVNLSVCSTDTTGGGGTFQDLVTASNTAITLSRRVFSTYVTTWLYKGTGNSPSAGAGAYIPTNKAMFTYQSAGSVNAGDILFGADQTNAATNQTNARISFPYPGVYTVTWSVRFQNTVNASGGENDSMFGPCFSTQFGESGLNANGSRIGWGSTCAFNTISTYTGFFVRQEGLFLMAYSSGSNNLVGNLGHWLTVTLQQQTAIS